MKSSILLLTAGAVIGVLATLGVERLYSERKGRDWMLEEIRHSEKIGEHLDDICQAISKADRVEMVVHSWSFENKGDKGPFLLVPSCEEYLRFELTDAQRDGLRTAVGYTAPVRKQTFSTCIFFAHFTIDFWEGAEVTRKLQIGFECQEVRLLSRRDSEWVEDGGVGSECIISSLRGFFEGLGLDTREFSPNNPNKSE